MPIPRVPSIQEKQYLMKSLISRGHTSEEAKLLVEESSYIAVFDNYMTSSPGYAGKVMLVLWDSAPTHFELHTFGDENYPPVVLQERVR